jgi:uncharacterized protein DUF1707
VTDDAQLRASDAQRDRAAAEIREHYAAGRLTEDEFAERLDAVYQARTQGELSELRRDLPALPVDTRTDVAERRRRLRGELFQETGAALVPFFICTAIWAFSGASGSFWPIWVSLIAIIPLIRNGWALYGPGADLDEYERRRSEDRAQRREQRREQRERRG